jgi:hypothetical protein
MLLRPALASAVLLIAATASAQIRRDPNGVNVNTNGPTSVFISYGGLRDQTAVEALWCGALVPATPDVGFKCDPSTVYGRLPLRYDVSRTGSGTLTDVMSIPASVARRAYEAARRGETSSFFYVRRFVSAAGGRDEYVFVTCRLAGGGARVPFSLLDVQLSYASGESVASVRTGSRLPPFEARIVFNGTGRLSGRWEVVTPGEELPSTRDLLTEGSLPVEERSLQRRYAVVQRFSAFLPPGGRHTIPGPDLSRLPTAVEGMHVVLFRVDATDDKEGDSNLALAGAGSGVVHSGAVAGFPMPVLRYFVGGAGEGSVMAGSLQQVHPAEGGAFGQGAGAQFTWTEDVSAALYRLEVVDLAGQPVLEAMVLPGVGAYRAPSWLAERAPEGQLQWRVRALGPAGESLAETSWRRFRTP